MRQLDINRLDLNLIKVFIALYEESTVTAAGDRLGLAQSSMSHALARLRETLEDQLFVRTTAGMSPTTFASVLIEPLRRTLSDLERAINQNALFDPLTCDRTFTLITTDSVEMILLPKLMASLALVAPGVQIAARQMPRSEYRDALEAGQADLALGQLPVGHTDFYQQSLCERPFACFMRVGHPLTLLPSLDFDAFMNARHLVVNHPAMAETHVKKALGFQAAKRKVALQMPHYLVAPFILRSTDLVAVMPTTLEEYFSSLEMIVGLPLPFEIEPITIRQFWHQRVHEDPGCQWLRQTIASFFTGDGHRAYMIDLVHSADAACPLARPRVTD